MFRLSKKGRLFVGFFIGLCCPLVLQAQNLAVRLRTTGDTAFAGTALRQIAKLDYAYLAVYGTERNNNAQAILKGKYFGLWYESNGSGGVVPKTATQLATWIADSKNGVTDVKPTTINKDIVLLSSAPAKATQELADELGKKDAAAKRNLRKIIGWEEDVLLYQNGFFRAYGKCFQYELGKAPQELTGTAIPTGNPQGTTPADTDFIVLSQASNIYLEWLETWPIATRGVIKEAARLSRSRVPELYQYLLQHKTDFIGWTYLWEQSFNGGGLRGDTLFIQNVATVARQYTRNQALKADTAAYSAEFGRFLRKAGDKTNTISLLTPAGLVLDTFKVRVDSAAKKMTVLEFFDAYKPTTLLEQQTMILGDSFQKELDGTSNTVLPPNLWGDLRKALTIKDYIGRITAVSDVRDLIMGMVNEKIGTSDEVDYATLIRLTDVGGTGSIITNTSSAGSIFEHWVRKKVVTNTQAGKLTFYFDKINTKVVDKPQTGYTPRTIDCFYLDGKDTIGVEMKHYLPTTQNGKTLYTLIDVEQLKRYALLTRPGSNKRIRKIKYVFSTKEAADINKNLFIGNNLFTIPEHKNLFEVCYVDKGNQLTAIIY
jgi:hypothetical protein